VDQGLCTLVTVNNEVPGDLMEREPLVAGGLKRAVLRLPQGTQALLNVTLGAWLSFTGTGLLYLICYHHLPKLVILSVGLWVALCLCGLLMVRRSQKGKHEVDRQTVMLSLCLLATAAGVFAGSWNYTRSGGVGDYWALGEHRQYTNVWPDELADAHRDAAVMVFSKGAKLEPRMLSAYKASNGQTYCVVPITSSHADYSRTINVQYFAAGKDCCSNKVFTCGDALNKDAHSGLVMYNKTDLIHTSFFGRQDLDYYLQASEMTTGKFGVQHAAQPIFLEWVADVDSAVMYRWFQSQRHWLYASVLALPLFLALSFVMQGFLGAITKGSFNMDFKTDLVPVV